jgi:hypothetical protein
VRTKEEVDNLLKRLYGDGDFALDIKRADEFLGTPIIWKCPHADIKVDRAIWYHFSNMNGIRRGVKTCGPCTKELVEDPRYGVLEVVCRTSKVVLDFEGIRDVIRTREVEMVTELGKRLEQEVMDEAKRDEPAN